MSSTSLILERSHIEMGKAPVADAFTTTGGTTDIFNMNMHNRGRFLVFWGVGTTGTVTFTVEACDNVTPSTTSAIPFWYRVTAATAAPGAITRATSAGFTSTAGSNQMIEIELTAADLNASGYGYVRLKCTEVVDDPILGGSIFEALEPKHAGSTQGSIVT